MNMETKYIIQDIKDIIQDNYQYKILIDSKEATELVQNVSNWNRKLAEFSELYDKDRYMFIEKYKKLYKDTYDNNKFEAYVENLPNDSIVDGLLCMYIGSNINVVKWLFKEKIINKINMNHSSIPFSTGYMDGIKWLEKNNLIEITNQYYMYVSCISGHLDISKYVYEKNGNKLDSIDSIFYMCCDNNHLNMVKWIINLHKYKPSPEIIQELIMRSYSENNLEIIDLLQDLKL